MNNYQVLPNSLPSPTQLPPIPYHGRGWVGSGKPMLPLWCLFELAVMETWLFKIGNYPARKMVMVR